MPPYRRIGRNVARIRNEKEVTQLQLSLAMGFTSTSTVSMAETYRNGKHFSIGHLYDISRILGVEMGELLE